MKKTFLIFASLLTLFTVSANASDKLLFSYQCQMARFAAGTFSPEPVSGLTRAALAQFEVRQNSVVVRTMSSDGGVYTSEFIADDQRWELNPPWDAVYVRVDWRKMIRASKIMVTHTLLRGEEAGWFGYGVMTAFPMYHCVLKNRHE